MCVFPVRKSEIIRYDNEIVSPNLHCCYPVVVNRLQDDGVLVTFYRLILETFLPYSLSNNGMRCRSYSISVCFVR